jgi:hypothetical protein
MNYNSIINDVINIFNFDSKLLDKIEGERRFCFFGVR